MFDWLKKLFKKNSNPNMTIETFVSESLVQICNGVRSAQQKIAIKPIEKNDEEHYAPYIMPSPIGGRKDELTLVNFDIAVTVEYAEASSKNDKATLKSQIFVMQGDVALENIDSAKSGHSSISRIQFSIPVIYPKMPYKY